MSLKIPIKPLILVGPSGSGRSAIIFNLTMNLPHKFHRVISHTTRQPRPTEKDKSCFYFTDESFIEKMDENSELLTLTKSPNNHFYGLSKKEVNDVKDSGKIPIFKMTLSAYLKNLQKLHKET